MHILECGFVGILVNNIVNICIFVYIQRERERNRVGGKMVKRKGRRGQKRKSARIKALEASKKAKKESNNNNSSLRTEEERNQEISRDQHNAALEGMEEAASGRQSMPEPRRGRKKKRLDEVAVTSAGPTTQQVCFIFFL